MIAHRPCRERPSPSARALFDLPRDVAYLNCASPRPADAPRASAAGEGALAPARASRGRSRRRTGSTRSSGGVRCSPRLAGVSAENVALVPASSYGLADGGRRTLRAGPGPARAAHRRGLSLQRVHLARLLRAPRRGDRYRIAARRGRAGPRQCSPRSTSASPSSRCRTCTGLTARCSISIAIGDARAGGRRGAGDRRQPVARRDAARYSRRCGRIIVVTVGYKWLLGPMAMGYLWVGRSAGSTASRSRRTGFRVKAPTTSPGSCVAAGATAPAHGAYDVGQNTALETTRDRERRAGGARTAGGLAAITARLRETTGRIAAVAEATAGFALDRAAGAALPAHAGPGAAARSMLARERPGRHWRRRACMPACADEALRLSPHVYTDDEDIERLGGGAAEALTGERMTSTRPRMKISAPARRSPRRPSRPCRASRRDHGCARRRPARPIPPRRADRRDRRGRATA